MDKERVYQQHIRTEGGNQWNDNPDGCFYCGGDHPSDCCMDRQAQAEYWEE